ncbi:MAG: hypothetical protein B7X84_05820 [Alphaproteobacteria bacterium 17-39-52]|nr:MAG: hypothetical protein B7X84_05820 [Alphaproteobacteria bacterium 17-39-52]
MIEVIPNWHPIFVHFTVALFSTSVGFYVLAYLFEKFEIRTIAFAPEFETVARWCLWGGAVITFITVLAGLYAYNTVQHDDISHRMMTTHRNWALPTAGAIILMAFWSGWRYLKHKETGGIFVAALLIVLSLLLSTAWRGGELVYRYGLGVMSLPKIGNTGHHHSSTSMTNIKEDPHNDSNESDQHHPE